LKGKYTLQSATLKPENDLRRSDDVTQTVLTDKSPADYAHQVTIKAGDRSTITSDALKHSSESGTSTKEVQLKNMGYSKSGTASAVQMSAIPKTDDHMDSSATVT
jgi:hypothetical protein